MVGADRRSAGVHATPLEAWVMIYDQRTWRYEYKMEFVGRGKTHSDDCDLLVGLIKIKIA